MSFLPFSAGMPTFQSWLSTFMELAWLTVCPTVSYILRLLSLGEGLVFGCMLGGDLRGRLYLWGGSGSWWPRCQVEELRLYSRTYGQLRAGELDKTPPRRSGKTNQGHLKRFLLQANKRPSRNFFCVSVNFIDTTIWVHLQGYTPLPPI